MLILLHIALGDFAVGLVRIKLGQIKQVRGKSETCSLYWTYVLQRSHNVGFVGLVSKLESTLENLS